MTYPRDAVIPAKYPEKPTATAAPVTVYASSSDQPHKKAMPSPREAKVYEYTLPDAGIMEANSLYVKPTRIQRTPAMTKERARPGPA